MRLAWAVRSTFARTVGPSVGERMVSKVDGCAAFGGTMPSSAPMLVNRGNEGDDWKCLRAPGRPSPGVAGIASRICCGGGFVEAGVRIVKPRLLGFLLGGVGGFTNEGEAIVERLECSSAGRGRLVVEAARPGFRDVLTARFFRLRPFLGGGCFCSSKKGLQSSEVRGRCIPTANVVGGGDSGDDPGDGSVALESSTVEIVVVGEESFDPEVTSLRL